MTTPKSTRRTVMVKHCYREIDTALSFVRTSKLPRAQVFQANIEVDWDLPNFLKDQEYDTTLENAVESAITIIGSGNNAQALSCMEYMCQTWPSSGREVVCSLVKTLTSPQLSHTSKLNLIQSNGAAWNPLTKHMNVITLFGQNFGDIYKPAENARRLMCENWKAVPQGHDYLTAPISLLKDMEQRSWEEGEIERGSSQIAKDVFWSPSKHMFNCSNPYRGHTHNCAQQLLFHKPHSGRKLIMRIFGGERPFKD